MGKQIKGSAFIVVIAFLLVACVSSTSQVSKQRLSEVKTIDLVLSDEGEDGHPFYFSEDAGTIGSVGAVGGLLGGLVAISVSTAFNNKWISHAGEILDLGRALDVNAKLLEAIGDQYTSLGYSVEPQITKTATNGKESAKDFVQKSDKDMVVLMYPTYRLSRGYKIIGEMQMVAYDSRSREVLGSYFNQAQTMFEGKESQPETVKAALLANDGEKLRELFDSLIQLQSRQSVRLLGTDKPE